MFNSADFLLRMVLCKIASVQFEAVNERLFLANKAQKINYFDFLILIPEYQI
jgi:hypothetical protein